MSSDIRGARSLVEAPRYAPREIAKILERLKLEMALERSLYRFDGDIDPHLAYMVHLLGKQLSSAAFALRINCLKEWK